MFTNIVTSCIADIWQWQPDVNMTSRDCH